VTIRYGYVGLGHLGGHLALSLIRAGFPVTVHDLNPALAERHLKLGASWAATAGDLARASDTVITCLPSPQISRQVLGQLLEGLAAGATWIEMSTVGRDEILDLAAVASEKGIRTLEAPVTGGVHKAAHGDITVLVGGDADLFAMHEPALRAMGGPIFHMGPLGSASVIKVITNMLAFVHLIAAGEALMLARRGGLDLGQSYHAIKASSGNSFVHETESQLILNGSYDIGFTMDLAIKDLGFAMEFGRRFGVPLDLAERAMAIFMRARDTYGGSAWSTEVVRLLEDGLSTDLRAPGFPARLDS
jgi:3-hydroxyisobutyrate dehydrogenase